MPSYQTHNQNPEINVAHTFLQGAIDISYHALVAAFGEPLPGDDYKTDAEWLIEYNDGTETTIATIYNYKNGIAYCGEDGLDAEDITEWNIGGYNRKAVDLINETLFGAANHQRLEVSRG